FDCFPQLELMLQFPTEYVMESVVARTLNTRRRIAQYKGVSKLQYNLGIAE
ncbi:hypothetical protein MKW98_022235, partial [Papaver atlanticum]